MNSDIVTFNVSAEDTKEIIKQEFLLEIIKELRFYNDEIEIQGYYQDNGNYPFVELKALRIFPQLMEKLITKYRLGIIDISKTHYFNGQHKRKVSVISFFIQPKEPFHVERLEDKLQGNNTN
jgi:hypothetical protein